MKNKLQVTEYWKNAVEELRKDVVEYGGCRLKYDLERNEYGDPVKMRDFQAVMKAKTVTSDFILTVDVDAEPESTRLDGLCVATFEGLAEDPKGEVYAVFKNGRYLPFLKIETPLIEDPAERTARELKHARLSQERKEALPEERQKMNTLDKLRETKRRIYANIDKHKEGTPEYDEVRKGLIEASYRVRWMKEAAGELYDALNAVMPIVLMHAPTSAEGLKAAQALRLARKGRK